jgi:hypothetical protein
MVWIGLFFSFFASQAWAEHRAFLLQISDSQGTPVRQIKSSLDPDQYRGYHPLNQGETITYIDTWMCRGRTGHVPTCPSPRELAASESEDPQVLDTPAPPPAPPADPAAAPISPP